MLNKLKSILPEKGSTRAELEEFISSLLEKQKLEYEDRIIEIEKIHQEEVNRLLDKLS